VSDGDLSVVSEKNLPLLKNMNKTVKLYEAQASKKDLNPALAIAINLAGRQRMLTQKMTKEFLLVAKGIDVENNRANLAATKDLFDRTLNGLIDGDAQAGLSPAPNTDIETQLKKVKSMWQVFKVKLEGDPTAESIQAVAEENLPLLKEMNKAVGMFASF